MFRSLKPKVLRVTLFSGVCLGKNTRSVVDSEFVSTSASRSSANVFSGSVERHRLESVRIIGSDGAQDDEK